MHLYLFSPYDCHITEPLRHVSGTCALFTRNGLDILHDWFIPSSTECADLLVDERLFQLHELLRAALELTAQVVLAAVAALDRL